MMSTPNEFPAQAEAPQIQERLGLVGAFASFEGTPFAPFIKVALENAGIEPWGYDPKTANHYTYAGLLATSAGPDSYGEELSPIVTELSRAIDAGEIEQTSTDPDSITFPYWSPYMQNPYEGNALRTSKLNRDYMRLEELSDAETKEVLGYLAPLRSDGGREGYALVSPNDVIDNRANHQS